MHVMALNAERLYDIVEIEINVHVEAAIQPFLLLPIQR
jgi:hypothetical protein